jgi:hypothetical protein
MATDKRAKPTTVTVNLEATYGVSNDAGDQNIDVTDESTIAASDDNIEVTGSGIESGVTDNVSDSVKYDISHTAKFAGSGTTAEPELSKYIQSCGNVLEATTVIDVNDVSGLFTVGEVISNDTNPATVGTLMGALDLTNLAGTLTVNGDFTGVTTISVANSGPKLDGDTLNIGDSFTIGSDKYVLTAPTTWDVAGNQDVTFTPALITPLLGGEAITITGRTRLFIFGLDTAPIATDVISGGSSTETATVQALNEDSHLFYPVSQSSLHKSITVKQNDDGKMRISNGVRGTSTVEFNVGDFAKVAYTAMGRYNLPTDTALIDGSVICSDAKPSRGERLIFDGVDMKGHHVQNVVLDMGISIVPTKDEQQKYTVRAMIIDDKATRATLAMSISEALVAEFDPDTLRLDGEKFPVQFHHNSLGSQYTRVAIFVPNAQLTQFAASTETDALMFHDITLSCNKACVYDLPKWAMVVY